MSISKQLLHVILRKRFSYSFKRTKARGVTTDEATLKRSYIRFITRFKRALQHGSIVAIDECGFDQRCVPTYAYSPVGTSPIVPYNTCSDRTRFSLVIAVSYDDGAYRARLSPSSCKSGDFRDVLTTLPFRKGTTIVLDNASIHKTKDEPGVSEALADISHAGGFRCCDMETWRRSMEAERRHHDVLDREFVANQEYAVWKMRLHRLKRASLDRNATRTIRAATHGQSPERLLLMGIGKAKFSSSGRGELSAPTKAVVEALHRQAKKETSITGRRIQFDDVEEFRTTICCSSCGTVTTKPVVTCLDREGGMVTRMSRRLPPVSLCT